MGTQFENNKHVFAPTHSALLNVEQPCNRREYEYFRDETNVHNAIMITLDNNSENCNIELIVNGRMEATVPAGRSFAIQKENVKSIKVKCDPHQQPTTTVTTTIPTTTVNPTTTMTQNGEKQAILLPAVPNCSGTLTLNKTFCFFCKDKHRVKSDKSYRKEN